MSPENKPDENTNKKSTGKNKSKIAAIVIVGAVILILVAAAAGIYLKKDAEYKEAIQLMESSDILEAKEVFESLESFKDSEAQIKECDYLTAKDNLENGDYETAAAMFALLYDYKDSEKLLHEAENYSKYHKALKHFNNMEFEEAQLLFNELGNFEDSMQLAAECQLEQKYIQAVLLMESGSNEQAKSYFEELADYKDSPTQVLICEYRILYAEAIDKIDSENFVEAWEILNTITTDFLDIDIDLSLVVDTEELSRHRNECYKYVNYENAIKLYEEGLYYDAYKKFVKAGDILDAEDKALSCIQTFSTKEIYHNPDYVSNECTVIFRSQSDYTYNECLKVVTNGGDLVSTIAIQPGQNLTIKIPEGVYMIVGGKGDTWFGDKGYFGDDGYYYKVKFSADDCFMGNRSYKLFWSMFITTIDIGEGEGNLSSYEVSYAYFAGLE